jgi:hypothetical protein
LSRARTPAEADAAADFVVRGALVVDGTGERPGAVGDVAVKDGRLLSVGGSFAGAAAREIDGTGKVLAPGLIDIHTHYDPQLCWDGAARPCLEHGVTTIVTGNCSLSVAPCRNAQEAERLVDMFFTIEDIKPLTFTEGVPFEHWETFGDWLEWLQPSLSVNLGALVGHSAVRLYVMGCGKRFLCSHIGMINSPRQARDKHKETLEQERFFPQGREPGARGDRCGARADVRGRRGGHGGRRPGRLHELRRYRLPAAVRKTPFPYFDQFTKTGSGQAWEKLREEWRVFCSPVPSRFADVRERTALASAMAKVGRKSVGEGPGTWACVHAFNDAGGKNTLLLYLNNQKGARGMH